MCRGRPLGQLGVVTDIMQSTSHRLLLQCSGGENLSLPRPKTFTAVEESGKGIGGRVVQSLVGWQAFGGAWSPLTKVPQSDRHMPQ